MAVICILAGIVGLLAFGSIITYRQNKSSILKDKQFTVKEKILVPVVGTVILYDFGRDSSGKVYNDDVLSQAFLLVLYGDNAKGDKYVSLQLNSDDGSAEFVFDKDSLTPSDRLKLMSVSTNVNMSELQLLNDDMTRKDIPNPVRKAFTLDVMTKIQSHVDELLEEAMNLYVERYVAYVNSLSDDKEE